MNNKNRIIGLDFLRILSMLGIIGLHLIGQGGILNNLNISDYRMYFILIIYAVCFLSVNIFGILSGYIYYKKELKYKRIVELIFTTIFYSIIITITCYILNLFNIRSYSIKRIITCIFPSLTGNYWYITCYIFVFFLIPYLNAFIKKTTQNELKQCLIVIFIFLSLIPSLLFQIDFFKCFNGYSAIWLIYCYLLGGYLSKYGINNIKTNRIIRKIIIYILCSYILNILVRIITFKIYGYILYNYWFINYISPFNIIASFLSVLLFSTIKFENKKINKIIICFSHTSFAVYIIHCHNLIYDNYLNNILSFTLQYNIIYIVTILFFYSIIIYISCSLIDYFRIHFFKKIRIFSLSEKIDNIIGKSLK